MCGVSDIIPNPLGEIGGLKKKGGRDSLFYNLQISRIREKWFGVGVQK